MTAAHPCDLRPHIGPDTDRALTRAIDQLARLHDLTTDDPDVRLHLIASLLEQGHTTLTSTVIDAIDHGHTNTEITTLLGL